MFRKSVIPSGLGLTLLVAAAVGLSCELGIWLLRESGRSLAFIWPAAGVGAGILSHWGRRALPGVLIGHLSIWIHFELTKTTAAAPFLYTFEAWSLALLSFRLKSLQTPDRSSMDRTAWRLMVAPWLAALPAALVVGWLATSESRFPGDSMTLVSAKVAMAHVLGMVALGPLTLHLLRRDVNLEADDHRLSGLLAGAAAFAVMWSAFHQGFSRVMSMNSAAFLAFPLVVMTGLCWRPPLLAWFMAGWCLTTSLLTGAGVGPFSDASGVAHPLELGVYNLIICSTAYLISAGSTRFLLQMKRSELSLQAAGVEVWEWNSRQGIRSFRGESGGTRVRILTGQAPPAGALAALSGSKGDFLKELPESWRTPIQLDSGTIEHLMSYGHVISRSHSGQPKSAIGLLQDLSAVRRADEALIALGHQRAQLKSLQSRLNPHFLFNALNALRALIHLDPDQASRAITTLARLLRSNLKNAERSLIPLEEELNLVKDLLDISKMRFNDRLQVQIDVEPAALHGLIPPMVLFNLVENAVVHGIERDPEPGTISIRAGLAHARLWVEIRNPGHLKSTASPGTGTRDVMQRLELLFAGAGRFQLVQEDSGGVLAQLHLPFRAHEFADS